MLVWQLRDLDEGKNSKLESIAAGPKKNQDMNYGL